MDYIVDGEIFLNVFLFELILRYNFKDKRIGIFISCVKIRGRF